MLGLTTYIAHSTWPTEGISSLDTVISGVNGGKWKGWRGGGGGKGWGELITRQFQEEAGEESVVGFTRRTVNEESGYTQR